MIPSLSAPRPIRNGDLRISASKETTLGSAMLTTARMPDSLGVTAWTAAGGTGAGDGRGGWARAGSAGRGGAGAALAATTGSAGGAAGSAGRGGAGAGLAATTGPAGGLAGSAGRGGAGAALAATTGPAGGAAGSAGRGARRAFSGSASSTFRMPLLLGTRKTTSAPKPTSATTPIPHMPNTAMVEPCSEATNRAMAPAAWYATLSPADSTRIRSLASSACTRTTYPPDLTPLTGTRSASPAGTVTSVP